MTQEANPDRYTTSLRKKVWAKAAAIQGHPPDIWRRDGHGNVMNWQDFGDTESVYGWKILSKRNNNEASSDTEHLHAFHHSVNNF